MKKKKALLANLGILLVILAMLTVSCRTELTPRSDTPVNPFTVVWNPGENYVVTFNGNSTGHDAGETSDFMLKLDNNSAESWYGRYIVQLLDTDLIVMEIADDTFSVPAGLEREIVIRDSLIPETDKHRFKTKHQKDGWCRLSII